MQQLIYHMSIGQSSEKLFKMFHAHFFFYFILNSYLHAILAT